MTHPTAIRRWREIAAARDVGALADLVARDVVFESPVVHSPQRGRGVTTLYLGAAMEVLGNSHFRYVGEWIGPHSAVLEFVTRLDDVEVNGVDIIGWNDADEIVSVKVMVRPLKAVQAVHQRMTAKLVAMQQQQQQRQQQQQL